MEENTGTKEKFWKQYEAFKNVPSAYRCQKLGQGAGSC